MRTIGCCFLLICFGVQLEISAQARFTLNDVLEIAISNSVYSKIVATEREIAANLFQSYKSDRRPQISFTGSVPMLNKSYAPITQPDGTIQFIPISQNFSVAGFSLAQGLPMTGGLVSLNTSLSRFDDFIGGYKQYNAVPVFIALSQPIGRYNSFKWAKRIEPLRYIEAQKSYPVELENIKVQVTELYFRVLEAQNSIQIALQNVADYKANYEVEQKRINLGTTTVDRLTQLELQILEAEQSLKLAEYERKIAKLDLRVFIGMTNDEDFTLVVPELANIYYPDVTAALDYARKNRPEFITFERKRLEAESELAKSRSDKYQVNLSASLGYNNSNVRFKNAYGDMKSQRTIGVEFDIPIVDWGRQNAKISTARANLKLQQYKNNLDEITLSQQITALVENLVLLQNNVLQSQKVQALAAKRYDLALGFYQSGKYTVTELAIAQSQKDEARKKNISALKTYWNAHFLFRKLTGYDPENNRQISY